MSIKNIFGAVKEEVFSAGGLLGTPAKAFVHLYGCDPLSTMNAAAKAATVDVIAESLQGNISKETYVSAALEGALLLHSLPNKPTLACGPHAGPPTAAPK